MDLFNYVMKTPANTNPAVLGSEIQKTWGGLPNPDWDQNDSSQQDYIKNRPCYSLPQKYISAGNTYDDWEAIVDLSDRFDLDSKRISFELDKILYKDISPVNYKPLPESYPYTYEIEDVGEIIVSTGSGWKYITIKLYSGESFLSTENDRFRLMVMEPEEIYYLDPKYINFLKPYGSDYKAWEKCTPSFFNNPDGSHNVIFSKDGVNPILSVGYCTANSSSFEYVYPSELICYSLLTDKSRQVGRSIADYYASKLGGEPFSTPIEGEGHLRIRYKGSDYSNVAFTTQYRDGARSYWIGETRLCTIYFGRTVSWDVELDEGDGFVSYTPVVLVIFQSNYKTVNFRDNEIFYFCQYTPEHQSKVFLLTPNGSQNQLNMNYDTIYKLLLNCASFIFYDGYLTYLLSYWFTEKDDDGNSYAQLEFRGTYYEWGEPSNGIGIVHPMVTIMAYENGAGSYDWDGDSEEPIGIIYPKGYETPTPSVYLKSSTTDSTKTFKITVDDTGTLTATEITETA